MDVNRLLELRGILGDEESELSSKGWDVTCNGSPAAIRGGDEESDGTYPDPVVVFRTSPV